MIARRYMAPFWCVAMLAIACRGEKQAEERGAAAKPPVSKQGTIANGQTALVSLRPQDRRRYVYTLEIDSDADFKENSPFAIAVKSKLVVTPLKKEKGAFELIFNLVNPDLSLGEMASAPELDSLEKELAQPYVAGFVNGIRSEEERFKEGVSAVAGNIFRTIASAFQVADGAGNKWNATELDGTGTYEVGYRTVAPGVIVKEKTRYTQTLISGSIEASHRERVAPKVLASRTELHLADGMIGSVVQKETIRSQLLMDAAVEVNTALSIRLDETAVTSTETRDRDVLLESTVSHSTRRPYGNVLAKGMFDTSRIAGRSFRQLLEEAEHLPAPKQHLWKSRNDQSASAEEVEARKASLQQRVSTHSALAAMFRLNPETLAKARGAVLAGSPAGSILLDAMGSAGTEEAQATLVAVIQNPRTARKLRIGGATSLIRVAESSEGTTEFLKTLLQDELLREHAVFGIGTAARRLRELGKIERSDALSELLVAELEKAETPAQKVRCLRGIANSAYTGALGAIEVEARSENAQVRAAAVDAVHLMAVPVIPKMLARAMEDSETQVRINALRWAIKRQDAPDQLEKVVSRVALQDPSGTARQYAVQLLGSWLPSSLPARSTLQRVGEDASDPQVQASARKMLGQDTTVASLN